MIRSGSAVTRVAAVAVIAAAIGLAGCSDDGSDVTDSDSVSESGSGSASQ